MRLLLTLVLAALAVTLHAHEASGEVTLRGSPAAMQEQNRIAKEEGLTFYRTGTQIRTAVESGELAELQGNDDYEVADFVSYPYVHPTVVLFAERLARQYREGCGDKLVVTSGTRPLNAQPANAHALSVHPSGLALDLRVSGRTACRSWLEGTLLEMESNGLLNVTREYNPPHYHVAIFPTQYFAYAQERIAEEAAVRADEERRALELLAAYTHALIPPAAATAPAEPTKNERNPLALALATAVVGAFLGGRKVVRRSKR